MTFIILTGSKTKQEPKSITGPFETREHAVAWLRKNPVEKSVVVDTTNPRFKGKFPTLPGNDEVWTIPFPR